VLACSLAFAQRRRGRVVARLNKKEGTRPIPLSTVLILFLIIGILKILSIKVSYRKLMKMHNPSFPGIRRFSDARLITALAAPSSTEWTALQVDCCHSRHLRRLYECCRSDHRQYRYSPLPDSLWLRHQRCAVGHYSLHVDAGHRDSHNRLLC